MINVFVGMSMAVAAGFLALAPAAAVLDKVEEARCPGRTRVQVSALGDWGKWGACPTYITSLPD